MFRSGRVLLAFLGVTVVVTLGAATAVAGHEAGFTTARPAQLVAEPGSGVTVKPLLSASDIVPDTGYQMSGIPDGLGAYGDGKHIQVLMNHELGQNFPSVPAGVDARISKITLDSTTLGVVDAEYLFDGSEGFERFCSSTLQQFSGTPYYFTGEEAVVAGHDGSSIAMNAETGDWVETPQFGHLNHENVVPLPRVSKFMVVTTDDDFVVGVPAYLYAYIADTFEDALAGEGSLYVWRANDSAKTDLAKGETIEGEFVPIPQSENSDSAELKAASTARGAFRFARLEDAATSQDRPGRLYFADTGKNGANILRGALYQMDVSPSDPTQASLSLLLDNEAGDDIFRPDNIDTSPHSVVIQEDGGQNRILVYDIKTGALRVVARTPNTSWESSGVINAQTLLGNNWWFVDVQSHNSTVAQPGPSLVPNSGMGEDGQLLAIHIPNS